MAVKETKITLFVNKKGRVCCNLPKGSILSSNFEVNEFGEVVVNALLPYSSENLLDEEFDIDDFEGKDVYEILQSNKFSNINNSNED